MTSRTPRLLRANRLPAAVLCAGALLLPAVVEASGWRPVPGAPDLAIDLASMRQDGQRVSAWLRWPGRAPLLPAAARGGPRIHRSTVLLEFDCAQRILRGLAAQALDGDGRPVLMATLPATPQRVEGGDLGWAYDAVCEAARTGQRL